MSDARPQTASAKPPVWARKGNVVLAMAILALAVFGTTTQTWINVRLDPAAAANADLHVQGSKAATAVTALALVSLAGGLASSIAGKVSRWIISTIIVLASAGIIVAAVMVLADPLGAAQGTIAATTGISGGQAAASSTVFPVLAVVAASLLALCGGLLPLAGKYWKARTKYDVAGRAARTGSGPVDEIDSWDSLSRGEDPT
ncbi:Trp biosynthesis-associated membrane protein [Arthrobacter bambusae]|uniref:Trp biosynthesis-associated membrane protein n=1 Tax=Arthrobacter bambusae TaxID=1338426 RepID=UPI002786D932|nr:Trp biosynthesis-associated membrane protein [Arthrobacter bambusae]MDQ0028810.1 putative membrane protein (TIGR02234 family) [Arthrobacter bambusae]MDQ0096396.1 putative membrane protein (TIGR02234 family) [Arthrobacter bambusae]